MKDLWLRAGVTLQITEEEEEILFSDDFTKGAETFKKIISEGRFRVDGESYVPEDAVQDFNEKYNTAYEVQEYGWDV